MISKAKSCVDPKVGEGYYILRYPNAGRTRLRCRKRKNLPKHRFHLRPHR